jgi:hypothetical protein
VPGTTLRSEGRGKLLASVIGATSLGSARADLCGLKAAGLILGLQVYPVPATECEDSRA